MFSLDIFLSIFRFFSQVKNQEINRKISDIFLFHKFCLIQAWNTLVKELLYFEQIKECADEPVGKGYMVSCLVDHRGNITEYQCHQYITKMTAIIFSDYRLICGFMDDCKNDINILKCGSIRLGEKVSNTTLASTKWS